MLSPQTALMLIALLSQSQPFNLSTVSLIILVFLSEGWDAYESHKTLNHICGVYSLNVLHFEFLPYITLQCVTFFMTTLKQPNTGLQTCSRESLQMADS